MLHELSQDKIRKLARKSIIEMILTLFIIITPMNYIFRRVEQNLYREDYSSLKATICSLSLQFLRTYRKFSFAEMR